MNRGSLKDRRSRFTKKEIKSSYIRLMDVYPKEKINVTLLCKEADINRGTFYLHYETIDDVWKDIENDLIQDSKKIFDETIFNPKTVDATKYVEHLKETEVWSKIFYGPYVSMRMHEEVMNNAVKMLSDTIPEGRFSEEEKRVYLHFMIGGCMAVERDRFNNPWKDFDKTNDFYNELTFLVSEKYAGSAKNKKGEKK